MPSNHLVRSVAAAALGLLCTIAHAAPLTPAELPAALRDWLPWAQQGQPPLGCPAQPEGAAACVW
ncbi:MAG: hypothetical protein ACT6S0_23595, partial [Roseateles sp.]